MISTQVAETQLFIFFRVTEKNEQFPHVFADTVVYYHSPMCKTLEITAALESSWPG